ncbi:MAG: hypothetical protein M1514_01830 [Patescibacteria group bacterium]|nr:hypothetical protein [Patescibacteria group bacterium]
MKIKKILTTISAFALLFNTLVPVVWAEEESSEISGNGAGSSSSANIVSNQSKTVVQNNSARITNVISSTATSGGNQADGNTDGSVTIESGSATTNTNVSNTANINVADLGECPSLDNDNSSLIKITGNGSNSTNTVTGETTQETTVFQENTAVITNSISSEAGSGDNQADDNTGGTVTIRTAPATSNVNVKNEANANWLNAGNLADYFLGDDQKEVEISGNGSGSNNTANLSASNSILAVQENDALVENIVDSLAYTGNNNAKFNTKAGVTIETGSATANTTIDNLANFNLADFDSLLAETSAQVISNGSGSTNEVNSQEENQMQIFQGGENETGNLFDSFNQVSANPSSGLNDASDNTGEVNSNLWNTIHTGLVTSNNNVTNTSGLNSVNLGSWLPEISFDFDLGGIFGFF